MSSSQDAHRQIGLPTRPSLPALLSTVLLLMACCVREGHGQRQGLTIPLAQGEAPRLRARSQQHLKTWAVNERLRINGKYGEIAQGSSSLGDGSSSSSSNNLFSRKIKPKKAKRQSSSGTGTTRASGSGTTAAPSSGSSTTRAGASASTTSLGGSSGSSSNSTNRPSGRANLTNYQSDL